MNSGDKCPNTLQAMKLKYGNNTYTAAITTVELNYNNGWQFGNPVVVNQTSQTYKACYESPSQDFIAQVVAFILNWLCGVFHFSWCA